MLLVGLPLFFISLAIAVTPDSPTPVLLTENGQQAIQILSMADVHGAIMVPITVAFLGGLAGLFVVVDSAEGDRLAIAGYRPWEILAARLGFITMAPCSSAPCRWWAPPPASPRRCGPRLQPPRSWWRSPTP